MGLYDHLFAAGYDRFQRRAEYAGQAQLRATVASGARGRVVEIGAGTGLNLQHYPARVEELVLTEPAQPMARRLERLVARSERPARVVRATAESLPFDDDSFDTALCVFVLCTVDNQQRALAELQRVLKPGGQFLFLEHIRAPESGVARWQDRLHGVWLRIANGCHCNRPTPDVIAESPFEIERMERGNLPKHPAIVRPYALGRAVSPA